MATVTEKPSSSKKVARPTIHQTQCFIGGKWLPAASGKTFDTIHPATEEVIAQVAEGDKADIDLAVDAAREQFDGGEWSRMNARERGRLMYNLADLLEEHAEELAGLETLDNGKPIRRDGNIRHAAVSLNVQNTHLDDHNTKFAGSTSGCNITAVLAASRSDHAEGVTGGHPRQASASSICEVRSQLQRAAKLHSLIIVVGGRLRGHDGKEEVLKPPTPAHQQTAPRARPLRP